MGLPFNTFSVFDLLGLMVTAPLAVVFYIVYCGFGRHLLDLLFANLMLCAAVVCCAMFMEDNVVPAGTSALAVPGGAETTLFWFRVAYLTGLFGMPTQLHFILRYCRFTNWVTRNVYVVYGPFLLVIPIVASRGFFQPPLEPLALTSSWAVAVPWMPKAGMQTAMYLAVWVGTQVASLVLLYRRGRATARDVPGALSHVGLLFAGLLLAAIGNAVDIALGVAGYGGVSAFPFASILLGVVFGTALVKERLSAERHRRQMQRAMELVEHEMVLASKIQRNLLPKAAPRVAGFELAGWTRFASLTGGDTYDFVPLGDRRLMVSLGDASGHGMGPALLIAETHALLRATAQVCDSPSEILRRVDRLLSPHLGAGHFVTCFVGILEVGSAELTYASAGQGPILFCEAATGQVREEVATALPLGVAASAARGAAAEVSSPDMHGKLAQGDVLALVSDGCYEAANPSGKLFGAKRISECLLRCQGQQGDQILTALRCEIEAFVGSGAQEDDMTIVILRKL
jgi:serine phosphatase RsbU (regulator of sigma subunit)